jgi:uncharacterized protein YndB with AHSA1/START domain
LTTAPDCEIVSTRIFRVDRNLLYRAWTHPITSGIGGDRKIFPNTFYEFNFRVGSKWRVTMHRPGKGNYANECEFIKIEEPSIIAWKRISKPHFQVVATFEEIAINETKLVFRMLFNTADDCRKVKPFAVEKNEENFVRLENELAKMNL